MPLCVGVPESCLPSRVYHVLSLFVCTERWWFRIPDVVLRHLKLSAYRFISFPDVVALSSFNPRVIVPGPVSVVVTVVS